MKLYDNTRLESYRNCGRKFYFRHVRHWVRDGDISPPLLFGSAWHGGLDKLWPAMQQGLTKQECLEVAMAGFVTVWKEEGGPWPMDMIDAEKFKQRTPGIAAEMLSYYYDVRQPLIANGTYELISVESPFLAPMDKTGEKGYIGLRDKIIKYNGAYWVLEHKTTTLYRVKTGIDQNYIDSYSPNSQVTGYIHSLHSSYPNDKIGGVLVDISLVHAKHHDIHKIVPIAQQLEMVDAWYQETYQYMDRLEQDKAALKEESLNATSMVAFPRNTSRCFDYFSPCSYRDVCRFNANPNRLKEPPEGFIEDKWNPVERLNLHEIGITDEE